MLPGEKDALSAEKYRALLEMGDRLLERALDMTDKGAVTCKDTEMGFSFAVLGLYAKAIKTFRAIHLLCTHGLCEDAHGLSRTLLEILANILYLSESSLAENREGLARQYFDFIVIQDQKMIKAAEQNPALRGMFSEQDKEVMRQDIESAKSRMPEAEFKKRYDASAWHGQKIESVMNKVGLQSAYDMTFRLGSRALHATDFFDHFYFDPEPRITLKFIPGDRWAEPVLSTANLNFFVILDRINQILQCGEDDALEAFRKEIGLRKQDKWHHGS